MRMMVKQRFSYNHKIGYTISPICAAENPGSRFKQEINYGNNN